MLNSPFIGECLLAILITKRIDQWLKPRGTPIFRKKTNSIQQHKRNNKGFILPLMSSSSRVIGKLPWCQNLNHHVTLHILKSLSLILYVQIPFSSPLSLQAATKNFHKRQNWLDYQLHHKNKTSLPLF